MDLSSKFIGIFLFFAPMVILHSLESDLNEIKESDQIILNALESVIIAENSAEIKYYDDMEYQLEIDAQQKNKRYNITYNTSKESGSKIAKYEYLIIDEVNEHKSKVDLHYKSCKKDQVILNWSEGAVMNLSYAGSNYSLDYNEAGLVRKIVKHNPDDQESTLVYLLRYTDDEKISSVSQYKGKVVAEDMLMNETIYKYIENKIEVRQVTKANRKSTAAMIDKVKHKTFVIDDYSITKVSFEENDVNAIESVEETKFNHQGQIVEQVKLQPGQANTLVKSFEYNDQGGLLKESFVEASTQNIISHTESLYTYDSSSLSKCEKHVSLLHSTYDADGNLTDSYSE